MRSTITGPRAVATAFAALLLLSLPVAADADLENGGAVGPHRLRDTQAAPGAACMYEDRDGHLSLTGMTVQPPVMFARDRTDGRDGQMVGWRIQLLAWVPYADEYWRYHLVQVAAGPLHRAWATDEHPAVFRVARMTIPRLERGFQIRVRMTWYKASDPTRLAGSSRHLVEWYAVEGSTPWEGCTGIIY